MKTLKPNLSMKAVNKGLCQAGLAAALLSGWSAGLVSAAEDGSVAMPTHLEELVVTARKRAERLIDVPESIQAFSEGMIKRAGISSINDISKHTPNVVFNRRQDNEPNVVIRGVGGFGNTQGVGFYIDDVQNFTDQTAAINDIERIEVLKGPQGTLYGGSNIGGAVKFVTKKPGDELGGEIQAEVGQFGTRNLFGAINLPLDDEGRYASRISVYRNETDSFIRNTFTGSDPDASEEVGVRLAVSMDPSDDLSMLLTLRHNQLENGGNVYLRTDNINEHRDVADFNEDVFNDRKTSGAIFQLDYQLNDLSITSLSSYTRRSNELLWDLDYGPADAVTAEEGGRHETNVYTQELRLASDADGDFDWITGLYYARVENRGLVNNADVFLGVDAGGPLALIDFNNADAEEEQYAFFAAADYRWGDFQLGGGLRVNRTDFQADLLNLGTSLAVAETKVLPKLTLSYDLNDTLMLYAGMARGYEPARINLTSGTGTPYASETALNYEFGLKGQAFDDRMTFDVAAFLITYDDRQFETQVIDDNGVVQEEIANIGESESYGLEGSMSYRLNDSLTLSANAGFLHAEWESADFNLVNYDGNEVPASPSLSGSLSLDYLTELGNGLELGWRADLSHVDSFFWDIPNQAQQDSYQLFNLRLSIANPASGWELALRAENLFEEDYYNEMNYAIFGPADADGNCDECHLGAPGAPRKVVGTFSYSF